MNTAHDELAATIEQLYADAPIIGDPDLLALPLASR